MSERPSSLPRDRPPGAVRENPFEIARAQLLDTFLQPLEPAAEPAHHRIGAERYGERVKVYSIGDVSAEICGGPHVVRTSELGRFRIVKEEAVGSGARRIRAVLESLQ